ncbi:pyruvate dehydrogenase (acetyl-transferring) E1 component subunit alpha [Neptuniibacter sp.]|uniref:pyruvate dehydrogenase (acetyl-transferring) E1 component subunit alpha n=1 Tax=Neptuniibacter sp. TaxID=1962643 RepID=UPI00260C4950|nr:pyruvate dehydrogenase (acetyl-transferring) E1 component subunit alpha [Neptuniibacter sp.]MCP4598306.1 pyruvate dehydrogenase (acetyl-transferring) E1 component subunit alpha [Neptuniibacter sp.]
MSTPEYQYLNAQGQPSVALPDWCNNPDWLLRCYHFMVLARNFDAKAINLQRTGQLGTYASLLGSEAIDVATALSMDKSDVLVPYYRNHACQIVRGTPIEDMYLYWGGDERGNASPQQNQDLPNAVPIATQSLHACGIATAFKVRNQKRAAVTLIGDGGTSKGDFMEALNIAGVWQLPVVFIINNNQWAISVPREIQSAAGKLADKAIAAGIPGYQVDGNDVIAMREAVDSALQQAYEGKGSTLIEAVSYRLSDHTTADDATRYRSSDELKDAWEKDPVTRLRNLLVHLGHWDETKEQALQHETTQLVQKAADKYIDTPPQPIESMFDYLYAELPTHLIEQRDWAVVKAMQGGSHTEEDQL